MCLALNALEQKFLQIPPSLAAVAAMVGDQLRKNTNNEDLAELDKVNRQTYSTSSTKAE